MKILVVDDDRDIASLMADVIHFAVPDAIVVTATNGKEALDLLSNEQDFTDVIITDLAMPMMDGRKLCIELREMGNHGTIVLMTAHETKDSDAKLFDAIFQKPVSIFDIIAFIKNHVP